MSSTRLLLDALTGTGVEGATLLDVGGGVGVIQHELFGHGLASAVQVDASEAYLDTAKQEARRRNHEERTNFVYGDFVELAPDLPEADLVTLDRVICCYPDMERLVDTAAGRAVRVLGLVYPRERWGSRVALALANLWFRIRRSSFRVYLHPPEEVVRRVEAAGLRPDFVGRTFLWRVETYLRPGGTS